jgi:sugar transferase (PEP-CTERM/EpsH1 system associated)
MSRLRIIHVIDSLGTGGAEEGVRKLLSGLDSSVFEQIVCTAAPSPEIEPKTGARVISLTQPGRAKKRLLIPRLKRVFDRERPEIVHSRNWGAIEAVPAARLAGVGAVIHSEHGLELSTYRHQPWRRNLLRRFCFSRADRVFAVSQGLRDYYAKQLRIAKTRIGIIPNGVDTEKYSPCTSLDSDSRQKLVRDPNTLVIGTVGRLDPIKDHRTLFHAAELLLAQGIPVQLVIVGTGPERKVLEADVRARDLLAHRITFVGETSEIVSQLNRFDVFVLPSLAEGMSNALLEAMSVGLACIASRVGGNPELIEHGTSGFLFEAGDAKTLAGYVKTLAMDAVLRHRLGVNARKRIETNFSLRRMLDNYTTLYRESAARAHVAPYELTHQRLGRTLSEPSQQSRRLTGSD